MVQLWTNNCFPSALKAFRKPSVSRGFSQLRENAWLSRHFRAVSDTAGNRRERKGTVRQNEARYAGAQFSWLERLPVTQEAAGSSPVASAKIVVCGHLELDE